MKQYLELLNKIMTEGWDHPDRTGTGRRSIFGVQLRFDLNKGLPVVTTRGIFLKAIIKELLWFIQGNTNNKDLQDAKVNIWSKWAVTQADIEAFALKHANGDEGMYKLMVQAYTDQYLNRIGPMYGAMWRNAPQDKVHTLWPVIDFADIPKDKLAKFTDEYETLKASSPKPVEATLEEFCQIRYFETVDQLNDLIIGLKKRPYSARHIVTAWVPALLPFEGISPQDNVLMERSSLAPCHALFQFMVIPPKEADGKMRLSLQLYQRSSDTPVGVPYNIAQYSILQCMVAQVVDMEPYEFIWTSGDTHIYMDQKELVNEQLKRDPLPLPSLWLNPDIKSIFDFTDADIEIRDYQNQEDKDHGMKVLKYPVSM